MSQAAAPPEPGRTTFDLMEEAIHLLRLAPASALAAYYIGSLPFVLGVLYFWADMSRSPFAEPRLHGTALGLALLFIWMKCWQSVFADRLTHHLNHMPLDRWTVRRTLKLVLVQTSLQPSGLFLLPIASVLLLPLAWVYAFYQNVTILNPGGPAGIWAVSKRAWQQARLWPAQNNGVLFSMQFFGIFVWLNWLIVMFVIPLLLKSILGIETAVSQSPWALLNTTLLAAGLGLTYLCVDPILKALYLLRCFYGESLQTGQDLKAELQRLKPPASRLATLLLAAVLLGSGATTQAGEPLAEAPATELSEMSTGGKSLSAPVLDRTIDEIIQQPEYTWRMPREQAPAIKKKDNWLSQFLAQIGETIRDFLKSCAEVARKIVDWIAKHFRPIRVGRGFGTGWISGMRSLLFALIALLAGILVVVILRWWRNRQKQPAEELVTEAIGPAPDVSDENVGADQLPEQGWLRLAQELLGRGEWRLALRAFYLASLAQLAERNLITIARYKSNHDYERELLRRAHAIPEVATLFGQNVTVFDRTWYGLHAVDESLVRQFAGNVERLKTL